MATIIQVKRKKGVTFKVDIRIKGYNRVLKYFNHPDMKTAKKLAHQFASDVELQMQKGIYKEPINSLNKDDRRANIKTIADLLEYFRKEIAPTRYSYSEKYNTMYLWWIKRIGSINVCNLTSSDISTCKQFLINEDVIISKNKIIRRSANTVNKYLMALSAVLTYAVNELELIESNPMSKVKTLPKPNGRDRTLSEEEIPLLAQACKNISEDTLIFFLLLLYAGGRYSEVHTLQVHNIDFKNSRLYFIDTKNNTNRGVGVEHWVIEYLSRYLEKKNIKSGYIFRNKKNTGLLYLRGNLQKAIKNAGLKDFHIHDLRHTHATTLAKNGASLLEIAVVLGHKSLIMARKYSHLAADHTDAVVRNATSTINLGIDIDL